MHALFCVYIFYSLLYNRANRKEGCTLWSKQTLNGLALEAVTASLTDKKGKVLVSYKPYIRGQKQPIAVRQPVKRPREYNTVEELYINGFHLEQYKQHNYKPQDYYLEGLARATFEKAAAIDENEFVVYTYRQIRKLL